MPQFDLSSAPIEIAKLLMFHGSGTAPLQWTAHQNLLARRTLDQMPDPALFGGAGVRDVPMAAAVRAMLYLYTGWPREAARVAARAGPKERLYISGLCERHLGEVQAARDFFGKLDGHVVFGPLGGRVHRLLRSETEAPLKRFREVVQAAKSWEPRAFIELHEEARAGRLSPPGEQLVCRLQDLEFELLFCHCVLMAAGKNLASNPAMSEVYDPRHEQEFRKRMAQRRELEKRRLKVQAARLAAKKEQETASRPASPPKPAKVKVLCPKCDALMYVAEADRGRRTQCFQCGVVFLVPARRPDAANATPTTS